MDFIIINEGLVSCMDSDRHNGFQRLKAIIYNEYIGAIYGGRKGGIPPISGAYE